MTDFFERQEIFQGLEERVDYLMSIESGLTAWELDFIEQMDYLVESHTMPTEKQIDKIDELWEKTTV